MIEEVISNDYDICKTLNDFFADIVPNLNIIPSENFETTIQLKQKVQCKTQ